MADDRNLTNEVGLEFGRAGGTRLTLGWPSRPDPRSPYLQMLVFLEGPGFSARGELELEEWGGGSAGFIEYLDSLAADWRGWAGERAWEDDQHNLRLSATHDGIGYVFLDVSLRKWPADRDEEWSVDATVAVDAGQLDGAAKKLRAMIASAIAPSTPKVTFRDALPARRRLPGFDSSEEQEASSGWLNLGHGSEPKLERGEGICREPGTYYDASGGLAKLDGARLRRLSLIHRRKDQPGFHEFGRAGELRDDFDMHGIETRRGVGTAVTKRGGDELAPLPMILPQVPDPVAHLCSTLPVGTLCAPVPRAVGDIPERLARATWRTLDATLGTQRLDMAIGQLDAVSPPLPDICIVG